MVWKTLTRFLSFGGSKSSTSDSPSVFKATPKSTNNNNDDRSVLEKRYRLPTFGPAFTKQPFTKNHDLMDDMLDGVLTMRSFVLTQDKTKNVEAEAKARTEGVKVRDFAAKAASQDLAAGRHKSALVLQDSPVIELFFAHKKALEFFYLRFLINNGVYDLPQYPFTVEDVDRLYTCGIIEPDDLDNLLLCSMMGHGTYRRLKRSSGSPTFQGNVLPPRGHWTIPADDRRPTKHEIYSYISFHEISRFNRRYAINLFRIAAFERPLMTEEYTLHCIQRDGFWGLKRTAGIDDDQATKLFVEKDATFLPPKTFLERKHELFPRLNVTVPAVPQPRPSFTEAASSQDAGVSSTSVNHPSAVVQQQSLPFAVAPSSESSESSDAVSLLSTPGGCSSVSKGKKRARSPSVSSELDEDRRTRARLSSERPSASTTSDVSPCAERVLRRSTQRITERVPFPEEASSSFPSPMPAVPSSPSPSKGKKRARDDEPETEVLDGSSPTKKVKAADGVVHTAPTVPGPSSPPAAELDVAAAAPAVAGPSNPPATARPPPRPLRRQNCMLFNRVAGKFEDLSGGATRNLEGPDTEQGKFFARLEGVKVASWAELCARFKPPTPTSNTKRKVLEVPHQQPERRMPETVQPQTAPRVLEAVQLQPEPQVPEVAQSQVHPRCPKTCSRELNPQDGVSVASI